MVPLAVSCTLLCPVMSAEVHRHGGLACLRRRAGGHSAGEMIHDDLIIHDE